MPITSDFDVFVNRYKKDTKIDKYENQEKRINIDTKNLVRLTPENVRNYIGMDIMFQTRKDYIFKKINSISKTGKSIHIDHPDLNNCLQIVSRKVYVVENTNLYPNLPNLSYPLTDYNQNK